MKIDTKRMKFNYFFKMFSPVKPLSKSYRNSGVHKSQFKHQFKIKQSFKDNGLRKLKLKS